MSDNIKFQLGETAWLPRFYPMSPERVACPVCCGKRVVHLILGDDSVVELPCDYCGKGFEEPTGFIIEHRPVARAERAVIDSITTNSDGSVEYRTSAGRFTNEAYATEAEATAAAHELAAADTRDRETRAEHVKENQAKSYAWNAGYHMREAKRNRKSAEYHEKMAVICKDRAKPKNGEVL